VWISVISGIAVFLLACWRGALLTKKAINHLLLIFDAVGLGVFVIVGTEKALSFGVTPSMAVVLGMITGIGGGILRDILCNDIPVVFRKQLYATPALIGAAVFTWVLHDMSLELATSLSIIIIVAIRLLGIYKNLHLPIAISN
jgi:uncharacterized membrane protein YeiH